MHGVFTFRGSIQIYLDADYGTYPAAVTHSFTAHVRFSSQPGGRVGQVSHGAPTSAVGSHVPQPWQFDVVMTASGTRPSFQTVGAPYDFTGPGDGRYLSSGDAVSMQLISARWNLSPERGVENWAPVKVDVLNWRL